VRHIVSFSGGKDSTAMLFKMIEKDMQIDEVVFADIGTEFPEMIKHIDKVKDMISVPFTTECNDRGNFEYWMTRHIKTKGNFKGEVGYGWPDMSSRWCTSRKTDAIDKGRRSGCYHYQGIAADELNRVRHNDTDKYPLVDWGMTEADCLEYCYSLGFNWGGLYKKMSRVSCYLCPLQSLSELKVVYTEYPELWANMKRLDGMSRRQFRADLSLNEIEKRFDYELSQLRLAL